MPEPLQGSVHSNTLRVLLEEVVLVGAGVLLVFLGVYTAHPVMGALAAVIGAFLMYIAVISYRGKYPSRRPDIATEEEEASSFPAVSASHQAEDEYFERLPVEQRYDVIEEEEEEEAPAIRRPVPTAARTAAPAPREWRTTTVTASDYFEEKHPTPMSSPEPQSEFNTLLLKTLQIVKEVCFAHTVTFLWVKSETRQLVVEGKITDSAAFTEERKMPIGTDIVSAVGTSGQVQLVNNILPETERDILHYYKHLQDIRSFVGVPVFYANDQRSQPIGVLAVDSKAPDAYGEETVAVLSHVSSLIASLLISYTEKYDLFGDVKLIEAATGVQKRIAGHPSVSVVVNALTTEIENLLPWESIAVVLFDEAQRSWGIASARVRGNDRFVSPKQLIDLDGSVVGQVIRSNAPQTVTLSHNTKMIFNESERSSEALKSGMLVVVPVSSGGKCFGAVAVSDRNTGSYTKKDISALQFLAASVAPEFEIAELTAILNDHIAVDELTGTASKRLFTSRLSEELARATEREEDLSLVMVTLHNPADLVQRYDEDGKDAALIHVARHLRASVRKYDVVARYDSVTFAVVLADTIANDAFLWAEKLRMAIAGSVVSAGKKSFSISVTIGVSGASASMSGDDLTKNASHVLDLAKKAGGNIVRVF